MWQFSPLLEVSCSLSQVKLRFLLQNWGSPFIYSSFLGVLLLMDKSISHLDLPNSFIFVWLSTVPSWNYKCFQPYCVCGYENHINDHSRQLHFSFLITLVKGHKLVSTYQPQTCLSNTVILKLRQYLKNSCIKIHISDVFQKIFEFQSLKLSPWVEPRSSDFR